MLFPLLVEFKIIVVLCPYALVNAYSKIVKSKIVRLCIVLPMPCILKRQVLVPLAFVFIFFSTQKLFIRKDNQLVRSFQKKHFKNQ